MPIYEYRCSSCGFQKEYLKKVSDPVMTVCPECNKNTFSKMLSAAGFQLKGSGWYATDFKNSGSKPAAKAAAAADGKSAAKSDGKDSSAGKTDGKDSGAGKSDGKDASPSKSDGKSESKSEAPA